MFPAEDNRHPEARTGWLRHRRRRHPSQPRRTRPPLSHRHRRRWSRLRSHWNGRSRQAPPRSRIASSDFRSWCPRRPNLAQNPATMPRQEARCCGVCVVTTWDPFAPGQGVWQARPRELSWRTGSRNRATARVVHDDGCEAIGSGEREGWKALWERPRPGQRAQA